VISIIYPNLYVDSLFDINLQDLKKQGIRGIIFDLDNTIIPRDQKYFSADIAGWLLELKEHNFKLCIVSNNRRQHRVSYLAQALDIPYVYKAGKPGRKAFRRAMQLLNTDVSDTAVVGDQVFTDVYGGNRLGLFTILVVPLPGKEFWGTTFFNRRLEKLVLAKIKKRLS
jgi:HAD superfamily phosphatase (TIGR01668 family)